MNKYKTNKNKLNNKRNIIDNINVDNNAKPGSFQYTINGFKEAFLVIADIFKSITGIFKRDKGTSDKSGNKLFNKFSKDYNRDKNRYKDKSNKSLREDRQNNNGQMQMSVTANLPKRIIVSYEQFKHDCDMCKKNIGDRGKGTIQNVNLKANKCEIATSGNVIAMNIPDAIKAVSVNHDSWISNPSKLAQWRGWKEAELW